jgi:hypothetical protein
MNERITAESGCPDCAKVPEAAARVERASEAARELAPLIRDLTERTRQVSAEARSLLGLLRHLVRDVTALSDVHPRCGVCGLLAGPGHVVSALQLEPRGR